MFTAFTATCVAAYRIHCDSVNCMRQVAAHSLRRLVSRSFIRCYPEIQRMGTRVIATTSECIMFTVLTIMVLTVMLAETLRERAGFCKTADVARLNQTFDDGHVCILRGVTRATLIFLLDL